MDVFIRDINFKLKQRSRLKYSLALVVDVFLSLFGYCVAFVARIQRRILNITFCKYIQYLINFEILKDSPLL